MTFTPPRGDRSSDRRPAVVFAVSLVAAGLLLLRRAGEGWFLYDEWMWFGARKAVADRGDLLDALLVPHNEHLSLLPAALYGVLYRLVGLHSYVPYVAVVICLHLTVAALLRVVMRRAGVGPWVASGMAFVVVLLGAGAENIVWAFQVTFVGALAAGLGQLLLVDHEGRIDWRDGVGSLLGVAAVATQSLGILGVGLVGAVLALRRRWSAAAVALLPATTLYLWWRVSFGDRRIPPTTDVLAELFGQILFADTSETTLGDRARFAARLLGAAGRSLAPFPGGGAVALGLLVLAAVAVLRRPTPQALVPLVLAGGGVGFALLTAWNRAEFALDLADSGRYVYTVVVLVVPLAGLGVQRLLETPVVRRLPPPAVAGVTGGCLLVLVLTGWRALDRELDMYVASGIDMRRQITAAATLPGYDRVDPERPFAPLLSFSFGAAEVLPLIDDGVLPDPGPDAPADRLDVIARLLTEVREGPLQGDADLAPAAISGAVTEPGESGCLRVVPTGETGRVELRGPAAPASIGVVADVEGAVSARASDGSRESRPVPLSLPPGEQVTVRVLVPATLVLEVVDPIELCGAGAVAR